MNMINVSIRAGRHRALLLRSRHHRHHLNTHEQKSAWKHSDLRLHQFINRAEPGQSRSSSNRKLLKPGKQLCSIAHVLKTFTFFVTWVLHVLEVLAGRDQTRFLKKKKKQKSNVQGLCDTRAHAHWPVDESVHELKSAVKNFKRCKEFQLTPNMSSHSCW